MKRLSIPLRVLFVLLIITMVTACAPGVQTPSPEEIQSAIETSVAATIEAQGEVATSVALTLAVRETEFAEANPTATLPPPTEVPTLTPVLPTATPLSITGGDSGSGSGSGGTSGGGGGGSYAYSCGVTRKSPADNTEFKRTNTFDVTFTIRNTGTVAWEKGKDLILLGNPGPTLINPPTAVIELPRMEPNATFTVGPFDAVAPDEPGFYVIDFKLEGGFCYPYVAFNVVR